MGNILRHEAAVGGGDATRGLTRGVCRLLADCGYGTLTEFPLTNRRRADVVALDGGGAFAIVEVKSSSADFRADRKWRDYLPFCDQFYFAVAADFPRAILPDDGCGLIVADPYGAAILRAAPRLAMNTVRRRHQVLRFALAASGRLSRFADPRL